jgi:glucuronate isomerase
MKKFLDENFLLETKTAEILYHEHAKDKPIIDYHCHLPPDEIAQDKQFENLTQIWLKGDHYKWRALRANGIPEKFITGDASDSEKFQKWAETVPYTLRNPLYHWTHLELKEPFGITKILNKDTAAEIYEEAGAMLNTAAFSTRNILRKMNVEVVCTTDDPVDSLKHHIKVKREGFEIKMLPAWRPDKAMAVENPDKYNVYLASLAEVSDTDISNFDKLLEALQKRHDFFHKHGCRLSDHGIETFYAGEYKKKDLELIFGKVRSGKTLSGDEIHKFKSGMLIILAMMDHDGDFDVGRPMSIFFDQLAQKEKLAKTIVYNLNPRDNELIASMLYNFNDGSTPGKMQFGSGWWFLDQKMGMEKQMNDLSLLGLLSHFVGMLTDSRSFLSFPRHEYFRRILCNLLGNDVEKGMIPDDMDLISKMVENICYYNARNYFGFYED